MQTCETVWNEFNDAMWNVSATFSFLFNIAGAMPWTQPPEQTEPNPTAPRLQNHKPNPTVELVFPHYSIVLLPWYPH